MTHKLGFKVNDWLVIPLSGKKSKFPLKGNSLLLNDESELHISWG